MDMPKTKDLICQAANMATSVIIVGVGNADFGMMEELDGDEQRLRNSRGQECKRDIVQFVRFSECMARGNLAEEVLKEIPEQVCQHMESINFVPAPVQINQNFMAVQAQPSPATQIIGHHMQAAATNLGLNLP